MKQSILEFNFEEFVCEWLRRDLLNIAFGNSDNHGRNTALLKKAGSIWLAPIYDFAPMKADPEGISRTTHWGQPYERGGEYQWQDIANNLQALCPSEKSMSALTALARQLVGLQQRLEIRGTPERILTMLSMGFQYLDQKLERWGLI